MEDMYRLSVLHLNRLPYEVIAEAQRRGADHQVYLALAMLARDAKRRAAAARATAHARRHPKWAKTHAMVDAAADALSRVN